MVGNIELHADFEFPWRQPSGEVKEPVRCAGLELRREVGARDANLSLQSSTSIPDELTQGGRRRRDEKRAQAQVLSCSHT